MATSATRQVVEDYQKLFVNRRAYTMQSVRPHPESGRHYYFRPSNNETEVPLMLTDETIRRIFPSTRGRLQITPSVLAARLRIGACYAASLQALLRHGLHKDKCHGLRIADR